MIYIGHFSFSRETPQSARQPDPEADAWHGYFTCVAEGTSVDEALEKFKTLLHRLHATGDVLDDVPRIYLDSCIEIRSIPDGGFLAHYSAQRGERSGEISTSLREVSENQAVAYHLGSDGEDDEEETTEMEPFVVFDE